MAVTILGVFWLVCAVAIVELSQVDGIKINATMVTAFWSCCILSAIFFTAS